MHSLLLKIEYVKKMLISQEYTLKKNCLSREIFGTDYSSITSQEFKFLQDTWMSYTFACFYRLSQGKAGYPESQHYLHQQTYKAQEAMENFVFPDEIK